MKAVCWIANNQVRVERVRDPELLNPRDAIVRVTLTAICGSDLHLYDGRIPTMKEGDILGHEFIGEIVDVGRGVRNLRPGDRVVTPFAIACGRCYFCERDFWSLCDNSNPNAWMLEKLYGYAAAGLFGYSRLYGGYAGGQAEYVRVPFADVGPLKVSENASRLSDEQLLFLSDALPTGYMAAENCNIQPGDTVAVWGCGPVGLLALACARLLGAERLIAVDRFEERLYLAERATGAMPINYEKRGDPLEEIREMTGGRGPDACIDAAGMEAHGHSVTAFYDRAGQAVRLSVDSSAALTQIVQVCRKGGTVSIPGAYSGWLDRFPIGAAFAKGLTFRMGRTHVHKYMRPLLQRILDRQIDPSFVITHRLPLNDAPDAYEMFKHKQDRCIKVVMRPGNA